jgi:hypothetical protein
MRHGKAVIVASFLLLSFLTAPVSAQPAQTNPGNFGTEDGIDLWVPASQFLGSGAQWGHDFANTDYYTSPGGAFYAYVLLPQGAYLDSWRVFFYDNSPSEDISIVLRRVYDDITGTPNIGVQSFGAFISTGTPGYGSHNIAEGNTIDLREPAPGSGLTRGQAADSYQFFLAMPADPDVAFKGVRVIWHRQVSPAPATATFNDVPTSDPAFAFIEALAASGITAGCNASPPLYCPDATLTRRQMAVFLAKALGLHWPNS